jgi:hypothetical protein
MKFCVPGHQARSDLKMTGSACKNDPAKMACFETKAVDVFMKI